MGRKKIEIKGITNERNRQVTFLKASAFIHVMVRKQGLFKKCYELAVLCNIDIAVVILTKPTTKQQKSKLFRFASSDVDRIIRRQTEHDGDEDTIYPSFFTGEKGGDDEDENEDHEEDEIEARPPPKSLPQAAGASRKIEVEPRPKPSVAHRARHPPHAEQSSPGNYFTYPPPAPPSSGRLDFNLNRLRGLPPYAYAPALSPSSRISPYSYYPGLASSRPEPPFVPPYTPSAYQDHEYAGHQQAIQDLIRQHPEHMDMVTSLMGLEPLPESSGGFPRPPSPPTYESEGLYSLDWPVHVAPQRPPATTTAYSNSAMGSDVSEAPDLDNWINFLGHAPLPSLDVPPIPHGSSARELMEMLGRHGEDGPSQHKRRRVDDEYESGWNQNRRG